MNDNWMNDLNEKLENWETPAPEGLFDDVIKQVEKRQAGARRVRRVKMTAISVIAAAALWLLLFKLTSATEEPLLPQHEVAALRPLGHPAKHTADSLPSAPTLLAQLSPSPCQATSHHAANAMAIKNTPTDTEQEINQPQEEAQQKVTQEQTTTPHSQPQQEKQAQQAAKSYDDLLPAAERTLALNTERPHRTMSLALNVQNVTSGLSLEETSPNVASYTGNYDSPSLDDVTSSVPQESYHAHHDRPLKLGVSLAIPVGDRVAVETGMTYSYHSSEIIHSIGARNANIEQRLHYVGIPLGVKGDLYANRLFNLYISGGGEVEKMVHGEQKTGYYTKSVRMSSLQWSLYARMGAELKLHRHISLYAEPGLDYHFDNNTSVPNYYQDNKWDFGLRLGLRFFVPK